MTKTIDQVLVSLYQMQFPEPYDMKIETFDDSVTFTLFVVIGGQEYPFAVMTLRTNLENLSARERRLEQLRANMIYKACSFVWGIETKRK